MPEGFEYDPAAIREFAAVFTAASGQVGEVASTVGETSSKAADFGKSWTDQGARFEKYMGTIAEDLGKLGTHLAEVAAQLNQGTDLMIQTDTTGLKNIQAVDGTGDSE
ncbi:MAG TPA: hypothetical protein VH969_25435 [Actinophytocola sp.]|jgi:uncharacterized protein YukE|uniref:WXG100 family type VII secretion target n=1 Tax=Actinophytocola sp. TaxID=1872138 RepID=UPI002F956066